MIKPGKYQHYKGKFYQVIGEGIDKVTREQIVVYRCLYDIPEGNIVFSQKKSRFLQQVAWEGKEVPRFKAIKEELTDERLQKILSFLKEGEKLKHVERVIMISQQKRFENSAEHTWHMALMLITLHEQFPEADFTKMMKMLLIHDLVEIYSGDIAAYDTEGRKGKPERELAAAKKLFAQLPASLHEEYLSLFKEFEALETKEAKIVRACDCIQATLQNILSEGKAWKDNQLSMEWINNYSKKQRTFETFNRIYDSLHKEIVNKKLAWEG
jgi:putative hydrolases of HD superfamily